MGKLQYRNSLVVFTEVYILVMGVKGITMVQTLWSQLVEMG